MTVQVYETRCQNAIAAVDLRSTDHIHISADCNHRYRSAIDCNIANGVQRRLRINGSGPTNDEIVFGNHASTPLVERRSSLCESWPRVINYGSTSGTGHFGVG